MIKSKRGRKPKIKPSIDISNIETNNEVVQTEEVINLPKKRGRKPKGGKIIQTTQPTDKMIHTMPNIILHLHCTIEDVNNTFNGNNKKKRENKHKHRQYSQCCIQRSATPSSLQHFIHK